MLRLKFPRGICRRQCRCLSSETNGLAIGEFKTGDEKRSEVSSPRLIPQPPSTKPLKLKAETLWSRCRWCRTGGASRE